MNNKEIASLMRIDKRGGLKLISSVGDPYIGVDGIPEPCECAYFFSGGYVCLDSLRPHEFNVVTSIDSEMRAEEANG
jgi:hypothetical protein